MLDRARCQKLVARSSFLEKVSSGLMQKPFPALTNLRLWSADLGMTVPIISQGFLSESTRLQKIILGSISFLTLPKLLLSCGDLVSLRLMEIPNSGYISPEAMVAGLSSCLGSKHLKLDSVPRAPVEEEGFLLPLLDLPFPPSPSSLSREVANIWKTS
ncbi:hypothetical protein EDB89DRAFT_2015160 [Lactarius sanguifluus]|nr:hypothetical protein EDB89DRAFT_2015160 [Lactarius sanguifluus]